MRTPGGGYFYLATPYSKWVGGMEDAFRMASREAARLLAAGVPIFCPIAHTHPLAKYGKLDALSHDFWLPVDRPMMDAALGLIVLRVPGWKTSYGVQYEIREFRRTGKPIFYLDPEGTA